MMRFEDLIGAAIELPAVAGSARIVKDVEVRCTDGRLSRRVGRDDR